MCFLSKNKIKFFIAFAALVAVAIASPLKPTSNEAAQLEAIIAAIQSPSTDPATAALLEQQLQDIYGFHPIHVGPAIVETEPQPIQVGPAVVGPVKPPKLEAHPITTLPAEIPFPVFDEASPVAIGGSPLVQIIVNVNSASDVAAPVAAYPIEDIIPTPIHIVDHAQEEIISTPVHIVEDAQEEIIPSAVTIVEVADAPAEPIIIANPIVPVPVINIPETIN